MTPASMRRSSSVDRDTVTLHCWYLTRLERRPWPRLAPLELPAGRRFQLGDEGLAAQRPARARMRLDRLDLLVRQAPPSAAPGLRLSIRPVKWDTFAAMLGIAGLFHVAR
jgi:hypothetical protein